MSGGEAEGEGVGVRSLDLRPAAPEKTCPLIPDFSPGLPRHLLRLVRTYATTITCLCTYVHHARIHLCTFPFPIHVLSRLVLSRTPCWHLAASMGESMGCQWDLKIEMDLKVKCDYLLIITYYFRLTTYYFPTYYLLLTTWVAAWHCSPTPAPLPHPRGCMGVQPLGLSSSS